ncbi:alpha/beta hydrolase [Saccharothrix syringae]|uniref:Alpha/beta hydrolase n=2 Tax=Saccharothrix syringae TaxID=103733 RepID=A0A5Q0HFC8_SACSY|nr:alpha/beta hydrolase [Saccharothrix syringae]
MAGTAQAAPAPRSTASHSTALQPTASHSAALQPTALQPTAPWQTTSPPTAPTARAAPELRLPAPTGPHRVGVTTLHLVDRSRTDPWPDAAGGPRELVASVFYPARDVGGHPVAPQLPPGAAAVYGGVAPVFTPGLPTAGVDWAATRTHAHTDAPARAVRAPVVLYSPGAGDPRGLGTSLAEELASRGYVVVAVDHAGETSAVEFPDGRVRPIALTGDPRTDRATYRTMVETRLADTRFVVDQVEALAAGGNPNADGRPLPEGLARAVDVRRIGAYGQGMGGTTAAEALLEDRRLDAAINLEGYLDHLPERPGEPGELLPVARDGVDRPLLLVGTDGFRDARHERAWSALLAHGTGCVRWHQLHDASHWVLTDFAALAPQLQEAGLMTQADRNRLVGAMAPTRSVPLVRGLVVSFLDRHLRR